MATVTVLAAMNDETGGGGGGSSSEKDPPAPVIAAASAQQQQQQQQPPRFDKSCRVCQSLSLHVDWAQGDRICKNCGVVDEGHLLDDRPEWREFNDADDLAKGLPSMARSGLVLVDETMYFGGLQPTTLSKRVFGEPTKTSGTIRKRLMSANRKMDRKMETLHKRAIEDAKLSKQLGRCGESNHHDVRPEYEQMLLQEEEDANRVQAALHAGKWSLQRAVRLFGAAHEQETLEYTSNEDGDQNDQNLDERLDKSLQQSSQELYCAYSILLAAAKTLHLPHRVTNEATSLLCQYAAHRDGIVVRGVSSTLQRKPNAGRTSDRQEKEAKAALRAFNKTKQAGALCAALLFYTSRKLGSPRSLAEVCQSVRQPGSASFSSRNQHLDTSQDPFIKKKHCSRAMGEVKEVFPDLVHSNAVAVKTSIAAEAAMSRTTDANISSFTEHLVRKLSLPPVAEACVHTLVVYWQHHMDHTDDAQHGKLSSICGAITFFVCYTGTLMQRLAKQASKSQKRRVSLTGSSSPSKKQKLDGRTETTDLSPKKSKADEAFDVFDNAGSRNVSAEQRAYEMRRSWDAWQEQMPWNRSIADIEQSCGVASSRLLDIYRQKLFPKRSELLSALKGTIEQEAKDVNADRQSLKGTPLASVLLPQITVASNLLKEHGKI